MKVKKVVHRAACIAALLLAFSTNSARAATFIVTKTDDTADGTCDADCSLREAINTAARFNSERNDINFDATTFSTPQIINIGAPLLVSNGSNLYINGPAAGLTVQEGDMAANFSLLKVMSGQKAYLNLSNLTLRYGAVGVDSLGLLNVDNCTIGPNVTGISHTGTLTITNSTINDNTLMGVSHGSLYQPVTPMEITNCTISNNKRGISSGLSPASISDCTLEHNTHGAISIGGNIDDALNVTNCTFNGNDSAILLGRGIANIKNCTLTDTTYYGVYSAGFDRSEIKLTVTESRFTDSTTHSNFSYGIYNESPNAVVNNCTFTGSRNRFHPIYNFTNGVLLCTNSTFQSAYYALFNESSDKLDAVNCTLIDNVIAAINNMTGTLTTTNCTIVGNTTGIYAADAPATIKNSIVADNIYSDGNAQNISGNVVDGGHNITGGTAAEAGLEVDSSGKPALKNNGGATFTVALTKTGTALDASDDDSAPATDQRGVARPQGAHSDIGAFEAALLTIGDISIVEGNAGTKNAIFTITLSAPLTMPVSVGYFTANGTAKAGSDYIATSGTATIPAGQTRSSISVPINGDPLNEADETFFVNLTNATGAAISGAPSGSARAIGTILNDDRVPIAAINDVSVTEGNSGTANATFTVTLLAPSAQTISVSPIVYNGTAKAPADYTSGGARLIFAPGETSKTFSVPVIGDLLNEPNETFYVILSSPVNCSIGKGRGIGTIIDDDAPPSITIDDVRIGEGNSGQRTAAFRLKLSSPSGQVVKVNYATASGTATPGSDYVQVASTQVAFTTGNLYAYARVLVNGDTLNEASETFYVNLSGAQNATIARTQAQGTILNDDSPPALSINDVSVSEGNSGTKTLNFIVTLSNASGQNITVHFATADGIARLSSDYVAQSGDLTFTPGQTTKTISVVINGDTTIEGDETLYLLLSGATNASIGRGRGVGTILDDDASG